MSNIPRTRRRRLIVEPRSVQSQRWISQSVFLIVAGILIAFGMLLWVMPTFLQGQPQLMEGSGHTSATSFADLRKVYIVSHIPRSVEDITMGALSGRVTILDSSTQQELYSFPTGVDVDAIPSPNGKHFYIASVKAPPEGGIGVDYLTAIDLETGKELWQTELRDRAKGETGSSGMVISPDGQWLYYYSYPWLELNKHILGTYWLSIVNATTGDVLPETVPLPNCYNAKLSLSPDGTMLYTTCFGTDDVRAVNLSQQRVVYQIPLPGSSGKPELAWKPGGVFETFTSPDGSILYLVTNQGEIHVINTEQQRILRSIDLGLISDSSTEIDSASLSHDGKRLAISLSPINASQQKVSKVALLDVDSWQLLGQESLSKTVHGVSPLLEDDTVLLYGIQTPSFPRAADTVVRLNLLTDDFSALQFKRPGENIIRIAFEP